MSDDAVRRAERSGPLLPGKRRRSCRLPWSPSTAPAGSPSCAGCADDSTRDVLFELADDPVVIFY